ncbi:hypothetical protein BDZ90DRAFT_233973 [Jaminaea rosea]|uniref:Uncharacterized protein n=1 Tax=Jaminaea rosea TaxID=1569628 RepID=A0A316UJY0_9BASI|nr:hypothetical protein BDZ90DRAFT_233973 [Jaminaea rosea]PWN25529.1 hypothetical protein BDZ90DRAFT_233973 [Jaminaea rosea]
MSCEFTPDGSTSTDSGSTLCEKENDLIATSPPRHHDPLLKQKRSTRFYAPGATSKFNQAPFAGSAAKRESLQSLGSIVHLQDFYRRQGLAARQSPLSSRQLQPALGPAALAESEADDHGVLAAKLAALRASDDDTTVVDTLAALEGRSAPVEVLEQPITQSTWKGRAYPDIAKPVEADLKRLRQTMLSCLDQTCRHWDLHGSSGPSQPTSRSIDVLDLINTTTQAIRAVRNYLFALPPLVVDTQPSDLQQASNGNLSAPPSLRKKPSSNLKAQHHAGSVKAKDAFKRQSSFFGVSRGTLPQRIPSGSSTPSSAEQHQPFQMIQRRQASQDGYEAGAYSVSPPQDWPKDERRRPSDDQYNGRNEASRDPLVVVRSSALEVLGMLRVLEERSRIEGHSEAVTSHDPLPPSSSLTSTRMLRGDYNESCLSIDGDSTTDAGSLDGDIAYRSDLTLAELGEQRSLVSSYLATVNGVMGEVGRAGAREGRLSQHGSGDAATASDGGAEEGFPVWARAVLPANSQSEHVWLPRLRLLIDDLIPSESSTLGSIASPSLHCSAALHRLATGHLLCHAYNAALRSSSKPWGFIDPASVHDDVGDAKEHDHSNEEPLVQGHAKEVTTAGTNATSTSKRGGQWRRTDNLRRFAAAVQLRYGGSGSGNEAAVGRAVRVFDAKVVARRHDEDTGWQRQLESLIEAWLGAVVYEGRQGDEEIA